jgi:hypothetical protein
MNRVNVPNTFQKPNWFTDELNYLLTGNEVKVLDHVCRHILGWSSSIESRSARISLAHVCEGFTTESGKRFYGTGLSEATARATLRSLVLFGVLKVIAPNDPRKNTGALYCIPDAVDEKCIDALWQRRNKTKSDAKSKSEKGLAAANQKLTKAHAKLTPSLRATQPPPLRATQGDEKLEVVACDATTSLACDATTPLASHATQETNIKPTVKPSTDIARKARSNSEQTVTLPKTYGSLFVAIAEVCMLDTSAPASKRSISEAAKFLCVKPGISVEHVTRFGEWYKQTEYRGKLGYPPTPSNVQSLWRRFAESENSPSAVKNSKSGAVRTNGEFMKEMISVVRAGSTHEE